MIELYKKNHIDKDYTLIGLFREMKNRYDPKKVIYAGSHIHITPSLVFSDVTYVDSFRNTDKFFESQDVKKYIEKKKEYKEKSRYKYYHQDYYKDLPEKKSFDLAISQYAGFVGQAVKRYLKKGGLLLCNNSHGDASMASIDPEFELIGVYNRRSDEKYSISEKNLSNYLIPKKDISVTKELLKKTRRGVGYTKSPSGYIFKKL